MSRKTRALSESGVYHIVFRGVNHCHLFESNADYSKFLEILESIKAKYAFDLYAYCLMSNHVHLVLHEQNAGEITLIMKTLLARYASWFNRKYERSGALIADRYKSECVNQNPYLTALIKYIHNNPVQAGIVAKPSLYEYSSYHDFISKRSARTDVDFFLDFLSEDRAIAVKSFKALFANSKDTDTDADAIKMEITGQQSEQETRSKIIQLLGGVEPHTLPSLPRKERDELLKTLRADGISIRQIERATGISRGIVQKARVER